MFSTWYGLKRDFKDLPRRKIADKILRNKVFNIAKNPEDDGYQCRLASVVYEFFDEKSILIADKSVSNTIERTRINFKNKQLAKGLDKPIIRKLKKTNKKYIHLL